MLFLAAFIIVAQQPKFNPAELELQRSLPKLGGSLDWVVSDGRDSPEKWLLSLDIENKSRNFDCTLLKSVKRLYALRILGGTGNESSLNTLATLPKLGLLVITGEGISEIGLKTIAKCKAITKLDIAGTKISAVSLKEMAKMTTLRRVFLYNTKIKDADLKPLESMTFLEQLDLPETVSVAAAASLAKKLPNTHIERL